MQFFQSWNFLEQKGPPRNFLVLWDIKLPTQNRDPLFCIKSFDTRKFLKPRVVPLRNFPALWEKKFSTVNNDYPLLSFKISDTRNFLKDWESPYECFLYCEKNNFRQIRDTPSYAIFFDPEIFWKKRVPLRFFGTVRQKNFQRKSWYPLPIHNFFRQKNVSEKWRVPLRSFLVLWEIQFSTESWYTILYNFSNPEIFWNKSVPLEIFSVVWDKKLSTESRDIPYLSLKIFDKRTFLKNEGFSYENFRYCEKISFRQNRDTLPYAIFLIQNLSDTKGPFYEIFWYCETKKFRHEIVIPSSA